MDGRRRIRLTKYPTKAGWASKCAPGDLEQALEGLAPESLGGFVGGMETRAAAGFIPFGGGLLPQTVDSFAPVVNGPYRLGQIAAANALSDVCAMGGEPPTALNPVAFPNSLDMEILREILAGGQSEVEESGARLCGGHFVQDEEPKYGPSVTGLVETACGVRGAGARSGVRVTA